MGFNFYNNIQAKDSELFVSLKITDYFSDGGTGCEKIA